MSHDRPPPHHLLHTDALSPTEAVSPASIADVSLATLAGASAANLAQMGIVACLQALQVIEDLSARRALTAEVYELMLAQWRKNGRYKSTMASHLVEDVRPACVHVTIASYQFFQLTGAPHVSHRIHDCSTEIACFRRGRPVRLLPHKCIAAPPPPKRGQHVVPWFSPPAP